MNILQNPYDSYIASDLDLLRLTVDYLTPALPSKDSSMSTLALDVFRKLKDIAERYVDDIRLYRPARVKHARDDSAQSPGLSTLEKVSPRIHAKFFHQYFPFQNEIMSS